jgi:zinc/manganese transport system substrate-binding protein
MGSPGGSCRNAISKLETNIMRRQTRFFAVLCVLFTLASASAQTEDKVPVVATFSILADLVKNVGGERVDVAALVGPNGDAHVYQPSPADAKQLGAARLIIINGFKFEGWIDRLISASKTKAKVVVATKGITPRERDKAEHEGIDPHAWQAIANAKIYVANIRDGLAEVDPAGTDTYAANAKAYLAKLDSLENEVKAAIDRIPEQNRRIITTHDAFGYFGAAYGFRFIAPQGISTEAEPSARDIAKIIQQIRAEKVPAVFLENISDPRSIKRIAAETGVKIGGALFSDALSAQDGPAGTYIEMMHNNIRELSAALAD